MQFQNKKEIKELKEGLQKAKKNLNNYLMKYQILTTVTKMKLIANLKAREI